MTSIELFTDLARTFVDLVDRAGELTLEQRIRAFASALPQIYTAGAALPSKVPPRATVVAEAKLEFGHLDSWEDTEGNARRISDEIAAVHAFLLEGLKLKDASRRDADDAALAWWSGGFDHDWGLRIVRVLPALHRALVVFRADAVERTKPRSGPLTPPETTLLDPTEAGTRAVLGLRCEPGVGGMEVVAVHPRGPAAEHLRPGDLLLDVDGAALDGLTTEEAGERLAGPPGVLRRLRIHRDGETFDVALRTVPQSALFPPRHRLEVVHAQGAIRAAQALRILGCQVRPEGDALVVVPSDSVQPQDLERLLEAGEAAGVWRRT